MRGKMGLEMLFDDTLQGEYGIKMHTINSLGKKLGQKILYEDIIIDNGVIK